MLKGVYVQALFLFVIAALVVSACGQAATPASPTAPVPTATQAGGQPPVPIPTSEATAPTAFAPTQYSSYSPELSKKYLAEGFVLPGMSYGHGQTPQYGGAATFSNRGDLEGADPYAQVSSITNSNMTSSTTGDGGLVRPKQSSAAEPEGYVAESWTVNEDHTQWTFNIRKDIRWHDGTQFTAEDVKFWLDWGIFPGAGRKKAASLASNYSNPKEIQVIDQHTVRIILPQPNPFLLETAFSTGNVITAPRHKILPLVEKGIANPQMTDYGFLSIGPFKFDSYQAGSSFKVVRNDSFFLKDEQGRALPYLDSIFWAFMPDATVAVSAMRAGRIDATSRGAGHNLTPDHVNSIRKTLGNKAWFARLPYLGWGATFNSTRPPFNDVNLRRAVNLYSDRREQGMLVYGGFAIENAIMHPGSYWWNPDTLKWPGFNPETKKQDQADAMRLVKESGLYGTEVQPMTQRFYIQNGEYLDMVLKGLGFKTSMIVGDALEINEKIQQGKHQVSIGGLSPILPNQMLSGMLTSNALKSAKHDDPKIDEYHRLLSTTIDPAERRKILWEAEYYVAIDRAYVVNWSREEAVLGFRTYVKGIWVPAARVHDFTDHRNTWIDKSLR